MSGNQQPGASFLNTASDVMENRMQCSDIELHENPGLDVNYYVCSIYPGPHGFPLVSPFIFVSLRDPGLVFA